MKTYRNILLAATLTLVACTSAIAQTSQSSTPASPSQTATKSAIKTSTDLREIKADVRAIREHQREQLLARLIAEVRAGRALVGAQRSRIAALEAQAEAEQKNAASLFASYSAATREIEQLRTSVAHMEKAIALHQQTISILEDRNTQLKAEARKSRRRAVVATIAAAAATALRFLL